MKVNKLPAGFFRDNPLKELSAAQIAYFSMTAGFDESLESAVLKQASTGISQERLEKIEREKTEIAAANAETLVSMMRGKCDVVNRSRLCKKALTMQPEIIPPLLRRYQTSMQDTFIETATYILAHADQVYLDQLKQTYGKLWNPYTQSMACLALGVQKDDASTPLLQSEYHRLKKDYPQESYDQGPLLALYILNGRA